MRTLCLLAVLLAFTGLCCAGRRGHNKPDCDENGNPLNSDDVNGDGTAENQYWDDEMPDCEDIDCHKKPYEDLESGDYDKDDDAQMDEMERMKYAHKKCCRHRHHKRVMFAVGVTGAVLVVALAVVVACVRRRKRIARQARRSRFDPTTLVGGKQPVFMSPTDKKAPLPTAPVEAPMYMTSETKAPLPDGDVSRTEGVYETIQETPVKPDYVMNPPPYSEKA